MKKGEYIGLLFKPIKQILLELRALGLHPKNHYEAVAMYSVIGDGSAHAYPVPYTESRGQHSADVRVPRRKAVLKGALVG